MSISADELAGFRATQDAYMPDTCVHLDYSGTATNDYGLPEDTWGTAGTYSCGFNHKASREVMGDGEVVLSEGQLRLPIATVIERRDRFQITHRFGEALATPLKVEVIGEPLRGPSALLVHVKTVTDGS
jgi:hypothetical protein